MIAQIFIEAGILHIGATLGPTLGIFCNTACGRYVGPPGGYGKVRIERVHGSPEVFQFGRFQIDFSRRVLMADGVPLPLSSRAFEILELLIRNRDRVVTKAEIIHTVWPDIFVEDNNLAVHISAMRRVLGDKAGGDRLIVTVPGQGYRFVGEVTPIVLSEPPPPRREADPLPPAPQTPIQKRRRPKLLLGMAAAPAAVLLLVWGVSSRAPGGGAGGQADMPIISIVVMPFRNLSADTSLDHLVDAISDDLTTDLSHIPGSVVIARATSDVYKDHPQPASKVGRDLNVRFLLEGSIRADEDSYRVNAQLIDTATNGHLWADRFDVKRSETADPQSRIVQQISSALAAELIEVVAPGLEHDTRPLALFYRARYVVMHDYPMETLEGQTKAQNLLEQAIAAQPDFADAKADLGWLLLLKRSDLVDPDDSADLARARTVIAQALELAPQNPKALAALGWLQTSDGHCQEAIATYGAALTVDQNHVPALAGIAVCQLWQGKPRETIAALLKVMQLDPVGPGVKYRYIQLGMSYFMLGQYRDAIDWLLRAVAGEPDAQSSTSGFDRVQIAQSYLIAARDQLGETAQAKREFAEYNRTWPHQTVWHLLAYNTKAYASLPGMRAYADGLADAGMPRFADEHADYGVAPTSVPHAGGAFDPTPLKVPGVPTIDTRGLVTLLQGPAKPIIIDAWPESPAVIRGTLPIHPDDLNDAQLRDVVAKARLGRPSAPVVVTAISSLGWRSYNITLKLKAAGIGNMLWYRGGEEAWVANGQTDWDDKRIQ